MKDEKKNTKKKPESTNLENQIAALEENLKRALADYQNLERRVLSEKSDLIKYSNQEKPEMYLITKLYKKMARKDRSKFRHR